ncbi:hypothetical protein [Pasteurella canis]|uniref:SMODS and SLOG-associating 2TM effector domain-containing protein n=1 Tax=Pasteurella canis TaxID=753 RepID=A0ABQ4VHL5_9PAST|nr:hypothetical protein [Pasteurella canis]GJH43265.1 hypothetical protein PA42_14390 [Pasteurella canis]
MNVDSKFVLYYSHNLTKIYETFNLRISRVIVLIQILLGSSIAINLTKIFPSINIEHWNFFSGLVIAFVSALNFVYKFDESALLAGQQYKRYGKIISALRLDSTINIDSELKKIESDDVKIVGAFEDIAQKRTQIQLEYDDNIKLSIRQKIIAFISGENF